jgi:arylsulfatase A-like enzyme
MKKHQLLGLLLGLLVSFGTRAQTGRSATPPNILFILADDLGFGELSAYGAPDCRTPTLDSLARAGMRFANAYANSTVCSPTRAALLTGRYPDLVGVPGVIRDAPSDSWGYLAPGAVLLPAMLKKAGYHTAHVGKWHLGNAAPNLPNARGFDHFHGWLGDMMDDYYTHQRGGINWLRLNQKPIAPEGHATDLFTDWAIEYLATRRKQPAPFFLYLAYNAPHFPVQPPADWLAGVKQRQPGLTEKRARLVALIEHLDASLGRVLAALRANGQAEKTLVVFTSDNGGLLGDEARNGPWRGGKQDLYEGGIRVPAIAAWPGTIQPGSQAEAVTLTMDWTPTLLEAAGLSVPTGLNGTCILPTLRGQSQPLDRPLVWMRREGANYEGRDYYALRRGRWKLVQNSPFQPFELYDLEADPGETTNVKRENLPTYRELSRLLQDHIQRAGAVPWQRVVRTAD